MINKEFMIKKLNDEIKENRKMYKIIKHKLKEFETIEKDVDEEIIMNTMYMAVCIDVEITVYTDLIKQIKKGEFDKDQATKQI